MNTKAKKVALSGVFCSLAIAISFLETLIPPLVPVPGIKPGFSNIVTMFSLSALGFPYAMAITLFKAVFALITRGTTSFFMSLCGGILSLLITTLLFKLNEKRVSFVGIGVSSAVAHNLGQLTVATAILGKTILNIAPFLLLGGIVCGFLTGTIFKYTVPVLNKLKGSINKC